jgi:hypothetical protein
MVGYIVSYVLGEKLSRVGKQREILLDSISKIENQIEKLQEYFEKRVNDNDQKVGNLIIVLFDNLIGLIEVLLEVKLLRDKLLRKSLIEIKSQINVLWRLITSDELTNISKKYADVTQDNIKAGFHSLRAEIYRSKVAVYSNNHV